MPALDTNTWIALISAAFAGLSGAAAVGAVVAQYRLLPRPLWVDMSEPVRKKDGSITWKISIQNRGNAPAHDVSFTWRNNLSRVESDQRESAVLPYGEGFEQAIDELDDATFKRLADNRAWSVVVRWRQAPRLARKRSKIFYMKPPVRERGRQVTHLPEPFWARVLRRK